MNKIEEIDKICKKYKIKNYVINKDGSIDVNGELDLSKMELEFLPLSFNIVNGNCDFGLNYLITLKGSPVYVKGDLNCVSNRLKNLKYSPREIESHFMCGFNEMRSLEYGPEKVKKDYYCTYNKLISLKGVPKNIYGNFYCNHNNLTSLKYGPEYVYKNFYCKYNKLKNLKYCAKHINGVLDVTGNEKLYTFEITDIYVKNIKCEHTTFHNIWKLFEDVSKIELFNEMDIIRETRDGKPAIILDRLNEFLSMIGKPTVEKVDGYINI